MEIDGDVPGTHRFEILVVCTANLCRSPMVEGLLRATLDGGGASWSIRSAGTQAADGRPVHSSTARALAEHDVVLPEDWRSRQLTADDVRRADLVLTAARSHRSEVVRTEPQASSRTFTIRQFLRLLRTPDVEVPEPHRHSHPGDVLLDTALAARGYGPPVAPEADDIPDPVGRPYPVFRDLADQLAGELRVLNGPVESIHPAPVTRPVPPIRSSPWWASLRSS